MYDTCSGSTPRAAALCIALRSAGAGVGAAQPEAPRRAPAPSKGTPLNGGGGRRAAAPSASETEAEWVPVDEAGACPGRTPSAAPQRTAEPRTGASRGKGGTHRAATPSVCGLGSRAVAGGAPVDESGAGSSGASLAAASYTAAPSVGLPPPPAAGDSRPVTKAVCVPVDEASTGSGGASPPAPRLVAALGAVAPPGEHDTHRAAAPSAEGQGWRAFPESKAALAETDRRSRRPSSTSRSSKLCAPACLSRRVQPGVPHRRSLPPGRPTS